MHHRTMLAVVSAAALLFGWTPAVDARTTIVRRNRATIEFDDVYVAMTAVVAVEPDLASTYDKASKYLLAGDLLLSNDLKDAYSAWSKTASSFRDARYSGIQAVKDTEAAFVPLKLALRDATTAEIDAFEERVNQFAQANPDKPVGKQRQGIEDAREEISSIDDALSYATANKQMKKALAAIRKIKTFPYVAKPPKKDCGKGLTNGEFAEGPWGLYDFDEMRVLPSYFRANVANVTVGGNPARVSIGIGYCDGERLNRVYVDFSVPAEPGTYNVQGGFVQGPGGLCCSLRPTSSVTITSIDLENKVVAGTMLIQSSATFAGGPGRFLLAIDPE